MQVRGTLLESARTVALDADGVTLGSGTRLVRFDPRTNTLGLAADRERCLTLLAIATRAPVDPGTMLHLEAAAGYWDRGDKALANLRLVFAGLPHLRDPADAARLRAAEYLLDHGMPPRELLRELDIDASAFDLRKYDPDQPRVPVGQGKESGRWIGAEHSADSANDIDAARGNAPGLDAVAAERITPGVVQVAANGPLKPGGMNVVPLAGSDPLDPQGLNKPLSAEEQQGIADAINNIIANLPDDVLTLNPHPYQNRPDRTTGAILPPPIGSYTTYYVRSAGSPPGKLRLVIDSGGHIYYTNNHYRSFYPVDVKINK